MKKSLLIGITILLFVACQTNVKQFTMTSPEIDEVKALVKDYHEGNWEAWTTHYADTAKIFHNTWDENKGATPTETVKSLKAILSNMSNYHFEEEDNLPWYEMVTNDKGGTWVYFWGNWKGTLAANNKELKIPVHLALKFVNGKIAREEGFYNLSEFTAALQEIEATNIANNKNMNKDSECIKCQQKNQANHIICLQSAGNDDAKKKVCNDKLLADNNKCPCP